MDFTIYHIKPDWLRRVILVCVFPPAMICAMVFDAFRSTVKAMQDDWFDYIDLFKDCWHAKD